MSTYSVAEDDKLNVITQSDAQNAQNTRRTTIKISSKQMQWTARIFYLIFNVQVCAAE